jgi:hypothetical protein
VINTNKIHELCPSIADIFPGVFTKEQSSCEYLDFLNDNISLLGGFKHHILRLHDSPVVSMTYSLNDFIITLNNDVFLEHASKIYFESQNKPNSLIFPISLKFVNIKNVRLLRVSKKGYIKRTNPNELNKKFIYLYEELIEITNNNIVLAIVLWKVSNKRLCDPYRLLLIEADKIEVIQDHRTIWLETFGNKFIKEFEDLYNYFPNTN